MISIKSALQYGEKNLKESSSSAKIDAEALLSKILNVNRAHLYTYPEKILTMDAEKAYIAMIDKRKSGIPIAYLTNTKEFWSYDFFVNEDTLIPRPETELLVEKTLEKLENNKSAWVLELGTGSGVISIAIAKMRPDLHIIACDKSIGALKIAKYNAQLLAVNNIEFRLSNWFSNIDKIKFDAIVANPPYIAETDPHLLHGDVRFEPISALTSGENGLESLQYIIKQSYNYLKSCGVLLVEHGYNQHNAVIRMLKENHYQEITCWQDLHNNYRVSFGKIDNKKL